MHTASHIRASRYSKLSRVQSRSSVFSGYTRPTSVVSQGASHSKKQSACCTNWTSDETFMKASRKCRSARGALQAAHRLLRACCWMHAVCRVPHVARCVLRAACRLPRACCIQLHATCCIHVTRRFLCFHAACCTPLPVLPCCKVPRILPDPYSMLFHACVCECLCVCVCVTVLKLMLLVLSLLYVLEFQPPSPILVCKSHVCAVLSPGVRSLCPLSPVVNRVSGLPPSAPCNR